MRSPTTFSVKAWMLVQLRCSKEIARRLGALPAKMEGPVYRIPFGTILVEVGDVEPWHWLADEDLARLYDVKP
jgi:hypothetical protein